MTTPQRIQLRRTKGWRKPEGAIVVSRPSKWGNPYRVGDERVVKVSGAFEYEYGFDTFLTPALAVALFEALVQAPEFATVLADISSLRGHDLACWCPLDQPCHADVLLRLANA